MPRRSITALFAILAIIVSFFGLTSSSADATSTVSFSGNKTPGSTIAVSSSFTRPSTGSGNYVVDTEVYGPNGARVAQWSEQVWLGSSANVRKYSWNTSGLATGNYRVAQGVFTTDWKTNRLWLSNAGSLTLATTTSTTAPVWGLTAATSGIGKVGVSTKFVAPGGFSGQNVILDTEIYNSNGTKVAQWSDTAWVSANQTADRSYTWDTTGKPAGNYSVRQGVFSTDWSKSFAWKSDTAKFSVAAVVQQVTNTVTNVVKQVVAPSPSTTTTTTAPPAASSNGFWIDPSNPATQQAKQWQASRPADAALMNRIAQGGAAVWLGGWNYNVQADVSAVVNSASIAGTTPVFVAYNIPGRDCGSYSAGGANGTDAYKSWITSVANGIGDKKAWVVLEPDALSQLDCLDASGQAARLSLLSNAVATLEAKPNVDVYLDAGHPGWHSASVMAQRLKSAGVDRAQGFSLNVSNFSATKDNVSYGESVSSLTGGKRYVVDTSRNGNGSNGEWCNPNGRALGETPTTKTGAAHADAYLWVKRPGESDGTCNGGPGAGQWWADYALGLAKSAWG